MAKEVWLKNSLKIGLIACGFLALYILSFHLPPTAQAQNTASGSFAQPFNITMTNGRQFVQINNLGQAASSVEYTLSGATGCRVLLESSADNSHWSVLAQAVGSSIPPSTQFVYANGFYNYLRLDVNPDTASCLGTTFVGSYYGFATPMPINNTAYSIPQSPITSTPSEPYLGHGIYSIQGMQCDNPGASAVTLELFDSLTAPGAGSQFYQVTIPAGGMFMLPQNSGIFGTKQLWSGLSGAGSVECNFQLNFAGPWYPILPAAP